MRVFDNGIYRDATPEEIMEWEGPPKIVMLPADYERLDALELAIKEGLKL